MSDDSFDDDCTVFRPTATRTAAPAEDGRAHDTDATSDDPATPDEPAWPDGSALPVGTFLAEFELKAVVGEGGFGIVYLAWDHSLQRQVALKEYMPPSLAARAGGTQVHVRSEGHRETFELGLRSFVNEARLLARFDHRSLVKVYRFWEANGTAYMVMPYYEGETLKARLARRDEPPAQAWLMSILDPLSSALEILHREHCYHRDVAPDNIILLAGSDLPVLLDFGAARQVIGDATQALTVILKPGYAPVEQYADAPGMKQGPWTDVYALAATLHFAITGLRPRAAVARLVQDDETPLARSRAGRYSARFLQAIDDALRVRPEDRTQSMADLRSALGLPPTPDRSGPATQAPDDAHACHAWTPMPPRESRRRAGRTVGIAAGALAGLALAGAAAVWLARPPDAARPANRVAAAPTARTATPPPAPRIVPSTLASAPAEAPTVTTVTTVAAAEPPGAGPTPVDVPGQFDLAVQRHTPGFDVEARPLHGTLKIDRDDLEFSLRASRGGYVTLLVYGPDGSLTELLPDPALGSPRVRASQRIVLPSALGVRIPAGAPAGDQRFLVLVSAAPRDFAALGATTASGGYVAFPPAADLARRVARWPGPTPALLGAAANCAAPAGCDDYGAARFEVRIVE